MKRLINLLEKSVKEKNLLQKGYYTNIYAVGRNKIAKFSSKESIEHEYGLGKFFYENGVQVPRFYAKGESHELKNSPNKVYKSFFISDRISGETLDLFYARNKNLRDKLLKKYVCEIEKVFELGILPLECVGRNVLIEEETGKIFLIDFELYKKGTKPEINKFYKTFIKNA